MPTLLGRKQNMTMKFDVSGKQIPATLISAGPCIVVGKRILEKDGYSAYQIGFEKNSKVGKSLQRKLQNLPFSPRIIQEIAVDQELAVGQELKADIFQAGDLVKVTGVSKGHGFAGVMKRHGFAGGPKSHGQSDRERAPGSIGSTTTPGRVFKGKRMAGRMGQDRVTIRNLTVIDIDPGKNTLVVSGAIPGARGGLLTIEKIGTAKNFQHMIKDQIEQSNQVEQVKNEVIE